MLPILIILLGIAVLLTLAAILVQGTAEIVEIWSSLSED